VIRHHAPRMHRPAGLFRRFADTRQKRRLRRLAPEHVRPAVPATDHVIHRTCVFQPELPSHDGMLSAPSVNCECNLQSLTPVASPAGLHSTGPERKRREEADGVTAARRWRVVCRMFRVVVSVSEQVVSAALEFSRRADATTVSM
jgi:hypothetical protein